MTAGQVSDYTGAAALLDDLPKAQWMLGDRGYDADWYRDALQAKGITPCIPERRSRIIPVKYDTRRYRSRSRIETMFGRLKDWRRVATLRSMPDRLLFRYRARRHRHLLPLINESWTLVFYLLRGAILAAYIAEAEGRLFFAGSDEPMGRPSVNITDRWIKALVHEGIFEVETRNSGPVTAKSHRLTTATHAKLETYLNDMPKRHGVVTEFNAARTAQAENGYEAKNGPLPPIIDTED